MIDEYRKWKAKEKHLNFIKYCWQRTEPFIDGEPNEKVCAIIDNAIADYTEGISSFLVVNIPFRHGKSDMLSRYLPPHYLGMFPDNEVIVSTYGADLATDLSRDSRNIIKSDQYAELYPDIKISTESASVANWAIDGHMGRTHWNGVGGATTGKGYHLGIIDDYLKNRQDAESELIRERQWQWFTDVFLTRRAPVSITFILATTWHVDDISGRIRKAMAEDDNFPHFEFIKFPAYSDDYESGVLFPERFTREWYDSQKASLGSYGTASLLQCDPILKGGNLLKTDNIKIVEPKDIPFYNELQWVRAWDLASTEKELIKNDPDFTVGCLLAIHYEGDVPHLYIKDVRRLQAEAPERNRVIKQCALMDGSGVKIGIEAVAGYKDTFTTMQDILKGISSVMQINVSKDKIVRASVLEPIFEAGNVYLFKADWNYDFITELSQFPSGKHDDQVDALVCAYEMVHNQKTIFIDTPAVNIDYN